MRLLLSVIGLSLLMGCERSKASPEKRQALSYTPATAAEIFELRSKCAVFGEKVLENNFIGSALTQEQVTHYNPTTNRCYVRLEVLSANLTTTDDKFIKHLHLYDGQTREMLVSAMVEGSRKWAYILDGFEVANPGHPTGALFANYNDAVALIERYMADDRKQ